MKPNDRAKATLVDILADKEYIRQRVRPHWTDTDFLILSDLLRLLEQLATQFSGSIFDYGCGGSPYRSLFRQCDRYIRADTAAGVGVDCVLSPDGLTREEPATYDVVLSSQVLEHIRDPRQYLKEALRILKPGGHLILTTHGMFHEHGCPDDFHRWTSHGLDELLTKEGFTVLQSYKLTTDVRGAIQLGHYLIGQLHRPERPVARCFYAIAKRFYRWCCQPLLNCVGKLFESKGVMPGAHPVSVYVGVGVLAQKPHNDIQD